jgi:hypothetical protein
MLLIVFVIPDTFRGTAIACAMPLFLWTKTKHKKLKNKKSRILFLMRQR